MNLKQSQNKKSKADIYDFINDKYSIWFSGVIKRNKIYIQKVGNLFEIDNDNYVVFYKNKKLNIFINNKVFSIESLIYFIEKYF